ncbi:uncharacterized protein BYT42DRAFT_596075 [Radiomyces spectabilis]|uniref:uncharacterized protein n=1 Tax=Radiomyces spectabilis TaxID=64574 RepID=UPI00221E7BD3|nr:uncharacterized protein BYT42DRAFT_596075 [Radiomyces spectabilis]KAI8365321.1 hypothetical protein BYT42DRAFT_596075 [Radiomyces spectabilis]
MATTLPFLNKVVSTPKTISSVCVFCGSSNGASPAYAEQATGGGSVGLMGAVAKAVIEGGGKAKAVVPEPLFRCGSKQIAEVIVVPDMHTRKKTMGDECDAFVVLPGGFGTMEEMMEMVTWSQLNIHSKPIIILNTNGFYDVFIQWIDFAVKEKFVHAGSVNIFKVCNTVEEVLEALNNYQAPDCRFGLDWVQTPAGSGRDMT